MVKFYIFKCNSFKILGTTSTSTISDEKMGIEANTKELDVKSDRFK